AAVDVRSVFSWSYSALSPGAARLFRLLGLPTGPDISAPAVASLAGVPPLDSRRLLAELAAAHLVSETAPGRYRGHDLVRAYAAELSTLDDEERRSALHRLLDHYVHSAHAASVLTDSYRAPIVVLPAVSGVTPEVLTERSAALDWFATEQATLIAAISLSAE